MPTCRQLFGLFYAISFNKLHCSYSPPTLEPNIGKSQGGPHSPSQENIVIFVGKSKHLQAVSYSTQNVKMESCRSHIHLISMIMDIWTQRSSFPTSRSPPTDNNPQFVMESYLTLGDVLLILKLRHNKFINNNSNQREELKQYDEINVM